MMRWPVITLLLSALPASVPAQPAPTRPPERPAEMRPEPRAAAPSASAQPQAEYPQGSPDDDRICRLALSLLGASFRRGPPIRDPGNPDCGIADPVTVSRILPDVALPQQPTLRCDTALALALWTRDFLIPAAEILPSAPRLTGLRTGPAYVCRARVGTGASQPRISRHALGNAIDISAFLFERREPLAVKPRRDSGDLDEAFQRTARSSACLFFTTVLGPGTNDAHGNHLHLDVIPRSDAWRLCQ